MVRLSHKLIDLSLNQGEVIKIFLASSVGKYFFLIELPQKTPWNPHSWPPLSIDDSREPDHRAILPGSLNLTSGFSFYFFVWSSTAGTWDPSGMNLHSQLSPCHSVPPYSKLQGPGVSTWPLCVRGCQAPGTGEPEKHGKSGRKCPRREVTDSSRALGDKAQPGP